MAPAVLVRQNLSVLLFALGVVSSAFSGTVAWWVKGIAVEVRTTATSTIQMQERMTGLQEHRQIATQALQALQTSVSNQDKTIALLDQRLQGIERQLRDLNNRLYGRGGE